MTERIKVNLYDSLIGAHNFKDGAWNLTGAACAPKTIEWVYLGGAQDCALKPLSEPDEETLVTVFTDKDILSPVVLQNKSKYKIAFLNECRSIHPFAYKWILQVEDRFDYIFTHDDILLKRGDKYVKTLVGSTWVNDIDAKIYDKTKLLSHIASDKRWCRGHNLRHLIGQAIEKNFDADFWGSAYRRFETKLDPLKNYCFSITVMNASHKHYFTETLIDTFRCGTVPIFWGCENVGKYFNKKGILQFNTGPQLISILNDLSFEKYMEMMPYIQENFDIAKRFVNVDDGIAENIKRLIYNE